jgi:DNA polymerase-3 subunit delta
MVKVAPRSVARFAESPAPDAAVVLIYGPDRGQIGELAQSIIKAVAEDPGDPFRVAELTLAAIQDDPTLLGDEARAMSLTGGRRVVRVRGAADALTKQLDAYLDAPSPDSVIVLEAGELQARSSLRKLVENHARAAAIACYRDEGAGLTQLVKQVLDSHQVRIAPDAMRYVTAQLGADRQSSRNALEKLALYAGDGGQVTLEDAEAAVGDVGESTLDALTQAVSSGQSGAAQRLVQKLLAEGNNPVQVVRGLVRHFSRIAEARAHVDAGMDAESAVGKLRPPVFFRAKPAMVAAANGWTTPRLQNALDRLLRTEIDCKTTGMPAELICARAVLALSAAAPRRRR